MLPKQVSGISVHYNGLINFTLTPYTITLVRVGGVVCFIAPRVGFSCVAASCYPCLIFKPLITVVLSWSGNLDRVLCMMHDGR